MNLNYTLSATLDESLLDRARLCATYRIECDRSLLAHPHVDTILSQVISRDPPNVKDEIIIRLTDESLSEERDVNVCRDTHLYLPHRKMTICIYRTPIKLLILISTQVDWPVAAFKYDWYKRELEAL